MQLEWRGIRVDVRLAGRQGCGLMLLHGWMCSAEMMKSIQIPMSEKMRTAAIDFPGHGRNGQSAQPLETWGVEDYMELTAELIRLLDMAPCDIVGHSFGGRVAILLAATYPELVGRMVLCDAAGIRAEPGAKQSFKTSVYRALRHGLDTMEKSKILKPWSERGKEALVQAFGSQDYRSLDPRMRETFKRIVNRDLTAELPKIKASTLLFWGSADRETPLWMGQKMEKLIPDAGLVVEEGAGHFAYLERGTSLMRILNSFFLEGREP